MTRDQIELVTDSFAKISGDPAAAALLFYDRLFQVDPSLRSLFKSDMNEQGKKLMHMIGLAVKGLGQIEDLVPALRSLGARHGSYGVEDHHYDTVGEALLWTLETALGEEFTFETKQAWTSAYGLLAETMKDAASAPPQRVAAI